MVDLDGVIKIGNNYIKMIKSKKERDKMSDKRSECVVAFLDNNGSLPFRENVGSFETPAQDRR